ncbi:MAG: hypothetical protein WED00_05505 [Aquisalimonadaceae bacterium]
MPTASLSPEALHRLLGRRDLTDPNEGPHAMQLLLQEIHTAVGVRLSVPRRLCRTQPVRRQPGEAGGAGSLRLRQEPAGPPPEAADVLELDAPPSLLLVCPGPVFGRADDGRVHLHGHRLSLWYLGEEMPSSTLLPALVQTAVRAAVPGRHYRLVPAAGYGLRSSFAVEAQGSESWVHVGHCGIGSQNDRDAVGLVLELEPLLILRKELPDAALIHSTDLEVQSHMQDLLPYREDAGGYQAGA